jgi:hypothetical protein
VFLKLGINVGCIGFFGTYRDTIFTFSLRTNGDLLCTVFLGYIDMLEMLQKYFLLVANILRIIREMLQNHVVFLIMLRTIHRIFLLGSDFLCNNDMLFEAVTWDH